MDTPALLLDHVSKRYATHLAVDDLSLSVPPGTIYGILGPNGAGKSSTLRMAMNIIGRDSGEVRLLGVDPERDRSILRRVGYLPEERGLYRKMRVLDVVIFFGRLKGMEARTARQEAVRWLERMGLGDWQKSRVDALSKGMQQKVQFVTTVIHGPDLLILDEPASGLDPVNQEVLRDTILDARRSGRTVIFSTHNMAEAEQLCEYVSIIAQGKKVLDGNLREIRRAHRGNRWALEFDEPADRLQTMIAAEPLLQGAARVADHLEIELPPGTDPVGFLAGLRREATLVRFERVQPSLHEIFVERVGGSAVTPRRREVTHA